MLLIVLGLIAKLALVSGDCDVGKTVHDFDITKFTGGWYFLYHNPSDEYNNLECPMDKYGVPTDKSSRMVSYVYEKRQRTWLESKGFLGNWNGTGYSQKFDGQSKWNGRIYILAVDYKRYVISKLCTLGSNEVSTYVAFRRANPDDATMKNVKKALSDNGIDFNKLKDWNPDRCQDLRVLLGRRTRDE